MSEVMAKGATHPSAALQKVGEVLYEIPQTFRSGMKVPARVIADDVLLRQI